MEERKRFQNQTLDSEDYERTEEGAKALKNSGILIGACAVVIGLFKKYGPELLRSIDQIRKS